MQRTLVEALQRFTVEVFHEKTSIFVEFSIYDTAVIVENKIFALSQPHFL